MQGTRNTQQDWRYISTNEINKYCPVRVISYLANEDKNVMSPIDGPFEYEPEPLHEMTEVGGRNDMKR